MGQPIELVSVWVEAEEVIETAREQVAELIGARTPEIVFTSGGTESDNTALHAMARANPKRRHLITSVVEHSAVLSYCRGLEEEGYRITYLPVDPEGLLSMADLEAAITDETAGVSLMWANNQTGVLFPVEEIAALCQSRRVLYHCDAVQAAGKVPIDLRKVPIDYLSITGHKFGAAKGVGALYVRRKAPFTPLLRGGHQERNRRGGTESVSLIAGLGAAAEIARKKVPDYDRTVRPLRDALEAGTLSAVPSAEVNGHLTQRLPNTTNIHLPGIESETLLLLLDQAGVCASSGSACLADSPEPSHVIAAMKEGSAASQSCRLSLASQTCASEITLALGRLVDAVSALTIDSKRFVRTEMGAASTF